MTKKHITKNFKLSEQFNAYVIKHPEIFKNVPEDACIIMTQKSDPKLTEENLKIAKKIMKEEKKSCFKAIKKNKEWVLESISA